MVSPFLIDAAHPLHMVQGVFNAVFVKGNMLGDSMYYGRGAGKLPTASAVVSDVIDCARHIGKVIMCFWDAEDVKLQNIDQVKRQFFFRVKAGGEAKVRSMFGEDIREIKHPEIADECGFITPVMTEKAFEELYSQLDEVTVGHRLRLAEA